MSVRRLRDARRHAGCVGADAQVSMRRWCTGRGCGRRCSGVGTQRMRDDARRVRGFAPRGCAPARWSVGPRASRCVFVHDSPGLDRGRLACFPYRRADARFSVVVFDISGTQVNRPCAPSFEPDFE